jgi:hypothetical protein
MQAGQNCPELTDVNYATARVLKEYGPTLPTNLIGTGGSFPGVKRSAREADH